MILKGTIFNDIEEISKVWSNLSSNTQEVIAKAFSGYKGVDIFYELIEGYLNMTKSIKEPIDRIKEFDNICVDLKKINNKE